MRAAISRKPRKHPAISSIPTTGTVSRSLIFVLIFVTGCRNPVTYSFLQSSAENINKKLPFYNPDSSIRTNAVHLIGDTLVYEFTLLKTKDWEAWKTEMQKSMIDSFKISPAFKILKDQRIYTINNYRDPKKKLIFSIYITPDEYYSN